MSGRVQRGTFGVDPEGLRARFEEIFQDPLIFVRELLQNAVQAVRMLPSGVVGRIDFSVDPSRRRIEVRDNGVGMDYEQAQAAVSRFFSSQWERGARASERTPANRLLAALQQAVDSPGEADFGEFLRALSPEAAAPSEIGRFGIGLTTCLMVADRYDVITTPRQGPGSLHRVEVGLQNGLPTIHYDHQLLSPEDGDEHGTRVVLTLPESDTASPAHGERMTAAVRDALDLDVLRERIARYMTLVEVPILLNGQLVVGGRKEEEALGSAFFEHQPETPEQGPVCHIEVVRSSRDQYVRARLHLSAQTHGLRIRVYNRGILVGDLPTVEVLGEGLGFVSGMLDSDAFDLQLDRNRIQEDAKARRFRRRMGVWLCEELSAVSQREWLSFVRALSAHRATVLKYLYMTPAATRALGPRIPIEDALTEDSPRPLQHFLDGAYTTRAGQRVLAFASQLSDGHPATEVIAQLGAPVARFDLYVPTERGKVNLDLLFVDDYLKMTEQQLVPLRVDVLLRELSDTEGEAVSGALDALVNGLAERLAEHCELTWRPLPTLGMPGIVATPVAQMWEEEAARGGEEEGPAAALGGLIERMLEDRNDPRLGELRAALKARAGSRARPSVVLNSEDRVLRGLVQLWASQPALALELGEALVATLLLASTKVDKHSLSTRVYDSLEALIRFNV